jgi:hypothetical protein
MELEVQTLNLLSKNNSLVAYISGEEKEREQTRPVHLKKTWPVVSSSRLLSIKLLVETLEICM